MTRSIVHRRVRVTLCKVQRRVRMTSITCLTKGKTLEANSELVFGPVSSPFCRLEAVSEEENNNIHTTHISLVLDRCRILERVRVLISISS
ncbi:uncharacterized protein DS421_1g16610 [Arachis hypogaea]|nr:uncharacterized protein DS421_1g16610 [Arachis hypogaea]